MAIRREGTGHIPLVPIDRVTVTVSGLEWPGEDGIPWVREHSYDVAAAELP